jgi:tripartite-type tricarboxylate transporter receptor subunit TctC
MRKVQIIFRTTTIVLLVGCISVFVSLGVSVSLAATTGEIAAFEKDVVLVVPFNPGAAADTYAHMIKTIGEKYLGHTILLEYKPGGTGIVGMNYMLAKPHDGYTICILA